MPNKYEHMVRTWGGFYNPEHAAKHGLAPGSFWFDTKQERDAFVADLGRIEDELQAKHLAVSLAEGTDTRARTVAKLDLLHNGKRFSIEYDFGYAFSSASAEYMFTDGNYSCDCNLSSFIREKQPDFPDLGCGSSIKTVSLEVVHVYDE